VVSARALKPARGARAVPQIRTLPGEALGARHHEGNPPIMPHKKAVLGGKIASVQKTLNFFVALPSNSGSVVLLGRSGALFFDILQGERGSEKVAARLRDFLRGAPESIETPDCSGATPKAALSRRAP